MSKFSGHWQLVGYGYINDELSLIDGEPGNDEIRSWLKGSEGFPQDVTAATGLGFLTDGSKFSETASAFSNLMFDREGVQVNDYQPMSGRLHFAGDVGFILPDGVPDFALPKIENDIASRYSDGDTVVCDSLRRVGNDLIRQISAITDELYLDRMVLVYTQV